MWPGVEGLLETAPGSAGMGHRCHLAAHTRRRPTPHTEAATVPSASSSTMADQKHTSATGQAEQNGLHLPSLISEAKNSSLAAPTRRRVLPVDGPRPSP